MRQTQEQLQYHKIIALLEDITKYGGIPDK